ncbi:hypothetical protein JW859_10755 [bacterium]|nr:hypothetical protein [bacterium]
MDGQPKSRLLFAESQAFVQWWIWLIVLGIAALQWYAFYQQILRGEPFGDHPAPDSMLIGFWIAFGIGLPLLFIAARLKTEVATDAIRVQFVPFHLRPVVIRPAEIVSASAGQYNPLGDYGGWGIRYGAGGKAYNTSGNMGVRLELASGKHLLIGSQHAPELAAAINQLLGEQRS